MSPIIRIIVLAVAAIAAIGAFFMFRSMAPQPAEPATAPAFQIPVPRPEPPKEEPKAQVLVINRDMRRGEVLTPEDLQWSEWPKDLVNEFYFTAEVLPDAIEEMTGLRLRTSVVAFEPLLESKIVRQGQRGYLAAQLGQGKRAVSIQISPDAASGGFILPDDRVDVLLTHRVRFPDGQLDRADDSLTSTITIIRNARVLAIDQGLNPQGSNARIGNIATLELNRRAAEIVTLGEELGELSLTLRSLADAERDGDVVVSKQSLLRNYFDPYDGSQAAGLLIVRDGVATRQIGGQ